MTYFTRFCRIDFGNNANRLQSHRLSKYRDRQHDIVTPAKDRLF